MKLFGMLLITLVLASCALLPSKWDQSQASALTTIRQESSSFDCTQNVLTQLTTIEDQIEWVILYSDFRDTTDITKMLSTLQSTVKEFQARAQQGPVSPTYCQLKKVIIVEQADIIGATIKGSL